MWKVMRQDYDERIPPTLVNVFKWEWQAEDWCNQNGMRFHDQDSYIYTEESN